MAAPPTFLQSLPAETDATDGDIVTFQVKVSDPDPFDDPTCVSWWRGGEPLRALSGRRDIVRHGDGWHELVLANLTEEDEGEYECRAENRRGHASCFGSLYYYRRPGTDAAGGRVGTLTDVTMEEGEHGEGDDGRRSGLLILIDDGSQTEESSGSEKSNRKSMTVSEQMQGIIEDLTQASSQEGNTGSMTLERDEDEDQFNSDIEDLNDDDLQQLQVQHILGMSQQKTASEDTLVPSPDPPVDVAYSEGAKDPYARSGPRGPAPHKWSSNPNHVRKKSRPKEESPAVWPPEDTAPFDATASTTTTSTTSVEIPFARGTSTEEEGAAPKGGVGLAGAETPFDVADITEEAVDAGSSLRQSPTEVATTDRSRVRVDSSPPSDAVATARGDSLASNDFSVTATAGAAIASEVFRKSDATGMSTFVRSSTGSSHKRRAQDGDESSVHEVAVSAHTTRTVESESESASSFKRTKWVTSSAAYEADESTLRTESFFTDEPGPHHHRGPDVYLAIMDFRPMETDEEAVAMREGQRVEILDASKPRRWKVRVLATEEDRAREGWVPACYLERRRSTLCGDAFLLDEEPDTALLDPRELEAVQNREAIVKELVETEEDFAKDMSFVVEQYYRRMEEDPRLPKEFRDRKGSIFGNFKDISDFHNNVLMEGIHYHAREPTKLGKTFLRLERDFDMHANYFWNEARAQRLLKEGPLREYFDEHSRRIEDDKLLSDHLKLPIQRLNDYQLLLKELIKYSSRLDEDTSDLQKALDFIQGINKRNRDLQCVQAIQGCKGDLLKIGKIVRQEIFDVMEEGGGASERHVFLFKGRVFVTEKRSTAGKESYHVTHLFRLQDAEMLEKVESDPSAIQFRSRKKNRPGFPLTLRARSAEQKDRWCGDVAASQGAEDLGDLEPSLDPPPEPKHREPEEDRETAKRTRVEEEDSGGQGTPPAAAPRDNNNKKKSPTPPPPAEDRAPEPLSRLQDSHGTRNSVQEPPEQQKKKKEEEPSPLSPPPEPPEKQQQKEEASAEDKKREQQGRSKEAEKRTGEDHPPPVLTPSRPSEDDARLEEPDSHDATLSGHSSVPPCGAYVSYCHLLVLLPVLGAFYFVTQILDWERLWND